MLQVYTFLDASSHGKKVLILAEGNFHKVYGKAK